MDDFLLGSRTLEEHLQLLELWFAFGEAKDMYFKKSKSEFCRSELQVLGRRVGQGVWGPLEGSLQ